MTTPSPDAKKAKVTPSGSDQDDRNQRLVWVDCEMSGLDPAKETLLEVAVIVTDGQLNVVAEGPSLIIHQPDSVLDAMDEWNTKHHGQSGLTQVRKARPRPVSRFDSTSFSISHFPEREGK